MRTDWEKIKQYYISHPKESLSDIAARFKLKNATVEWHSRKEKWAEARKSFSQIVEEKFVEKVSSAEVDKRREVNEEHIKAYGKLMDLVNLFIEDFFEAKKAGKNNRKGATPQNLAYLAEAIAKCQKGQRVALSLDAVDFGDIEPEITIVTGVSIKDI